MKKKKVIQVVEPTAEVVKPVKMANDRSEYNCPNCGGDGLVLNVLVHERCKQCEGTGKV